LDHARDDGRAARRPACWNRGVGGASAGLLVLTRLVLLLCSLVATAVLLAWWLRPAAEPGPPAAVAEGIGEPEPRALERRTLEAVPLAAPRPTPAAPVYSERGERSTWSVLNDEAIQDLTEGDLVAAVEKFARCAQAEPGREVFANNLAEALVRLSKDEHDRGRVADAVTHLARAVELVPEREDIDVLKDILERWRRELELGQDDWTEGSNRFELSFDTDRGDLLHHSHEVLEHLERSYEDLRRWFGADPLADGTVLRVVLYDSADFDRLTGLGDWAGGVFDGVLRVSVDDLMAGDAWRSVLVHELVHAFLQSLAGGAVPGWLNEGVAQLLENRPGVVERARARLAGTELFSLATLSGSLATWQDANAIARAYAESLAFVDYLRRTYGDEALRRMLTGTPPAEAFHAWTNVELELAFEDWQDELHR